jgi:hypothetical protein
MGVAEEREMLQLMMMMMMGENQQIVTGPCDSDSGYEQIVALNSA